MRSGTAHFPRLKYCGFTRERDLHDALEFGADAIGLNFYPKSPRYISPELAARFSQIIQGRALRVGVFVNATPDTIANIVQVSPLDAIQLHGEEDLEYIQSLRSHPILSGIRIWRALPWRGANHPEDEAVCRTWVDSKIIDTLLIDAHDPIQRGGTGKKARWDLLAPRPQAFGKAHFLLAGGINESNVEEAIQTVRPDGIDLASGIESSPGIKDPLKMKIVAQKVLAALS